MTIDKLQLNAFIPYVLSVVSNEISQNIANLYQSRFDIDIHQWRVMAILGEESGLSGREVARRTAMDKVAVSRAVKKLEAAKLVKRQVDTEDKRRSMLSLTNQGADIYARIVPITKDYERALLEQLADAEIAQLHELLSKLRQVNKTLLNDS